jgi:hypothetical protein
MATMLRRAAGTGVKPRLEPRLHPGIEAITLHGFELPDNHSPDFRGNWYAFTVGSIRVLSLNNDDVCLQDGGFSAFRRAPAAL